MTVFKQINQICHWEALPHDIDVNNLSLLSLGEQPIYDTNGTITIQLQEPD